MRTIGEWLKEKFLSAPARGLVIADLFRELRRNHVELDISYKGGTYHSFNTYFAWFRQLGYVEPTGETEPSFQRGGGVELQAPRAYYRITSLGEAAPDSSWANPMTTAHPEYTNRSDYMKKYMKDRRKKKREVREAKGLAPIRRGRPRVAALAQQVSMFPEVEKPAAKRKPAAPKRKAAPRKPRAAKPMAPQFDEQIKARTIPLIKKTMTSRSVIGAARRSLEKTLADAQKALKTAPDKTAMGAIVHQLSEAASHMSLIETAWEQPESRRKPVVEASVNVVVNDLMV
jgi:hypothetical protein